MSRRDYLWDKLQHCNALIADFEARAERYKKEANLLKHRSKRIRKQWRKMPESEIGTLRGRGIVKGAAQSIYRLAEQIERDVSGPDECAPCVAFRVQRIEGHLRKIKREYFGDDEA